MSFTTVMDLGLSDSNFFLQSVICRDAQSTFSTDFYNLFHSTDKQINYGRIYGYFLTRFANYPPLTRPHCTFDARGISCAPSGFFFPATPLSPVRFRNLRIFRNSNWATLHLFKKSPTRHKLVSHFSHFLNH